MYSEGYQDGNGNWRMVCQSCKGEIPGSISPELFFEAHSYNVNRGGIQCPECRAKNCKKCGNHLMERNEAGLCILCQLEEQSDTLNSEVSYLSSCPYLTEIEERDVE